MSTDHPTQTLRDPRVIRLAEIIDELRAERDHHKAWAAHLNKENDALRAALAQPPREPLTDEQVSDDFQRRMQQHIEHGGWKCAFCGFDGQDNTRGNFFCSKCRRHK